MPNMPYQKLTQFEALAQRLIEGSIGRLLGEGMQPISIASHLARAMEDYQQNGQAANLYQVYLHPSDLQAIQRQHPNLERELGRSLAEIARQTGLAFVEEPQVQLLGNVTLRRHQVSVQASHRPPEGNTTVTRRPEEEVLLAALQSLDAFLIVDGKRHVPLDRPLLTIGRRTDNDIIIDSTYVSRQHAHLRWRYGRFVLYDLGGRGGTQVNGQLISESVLHPGDVILLSGRVPLIYGEGQGQGVAVSPSQPVEEGHTLALPRPKINFS